jgi:zinc D-Ala-D-Ala carboxypeptidase
MRTSGWRRLRAAVVALALAGGMLIGPLAGAGPVLGVGPLPPCKLQDVLTVPRGYADWATTLVDWSLSVGPAYKPPDLVSVRDGGVAGGGYVRAVAIDDLKAMARAAANNGTPLVAWSPYRSYTQQRALFNGYAGWNSKTQKYSNYNSAVLFSARPGHSEHQLGTTIDFVAVGDSGLTSNWEVTKTGAWMAKNAWKYGWLMSYPKGKQSLVCYSYEPWHYRYFGRELAKKIHDSGLTTREYLWANFTQIDPVTGLPLASASPSPSPEASASPATGSLFEPSMGPGGATLPPGSAGATSPPSVNTASSGVEPTVMFAIVLVALAAVGLIASIRLLGRKRGS